VGIRPGIRRAFQLVLRRRDRWEQDVDDEIRLHLMLRAEQLVAEGRTADDAVREAKERFGPLDESRARLLQAARHREAHMQRTEYFADLEQDLAFAIRTLGRQKAWTAVTILTLALGIGATTAVFSVVSALLLHPVTYPHADRVVSNNHQPTDGASAGVKLQIAPSADVVREWRKYSRSFESIEPSYPFDRHRIRIGSRDPQFAMTMSVLPSFADFAGERPLLGRMFTDADIRSSSRAAVVTETFWRNHLDARESAIGERVAVDDTSYTIVGVMPDRFKFGRTTAREVALVLPLDLARVDRPVSVIARLRPGVTSASAGRELDSVFARTAGFTNGTIPLTAIVQPVGQRLDFRDALLTLTGAVLLVLLVACANVAHLLVARAATRERELSIRSALGAGRRRLGRQLVTESIVLTVVAGLCGVLLGWGMLRVFVALRPPTMDSLRVAHLDGTTLLLATSIAIASGVLFGLLSIAQGRRRTNSDLLRSSGASAGAHRARVRGRSLLVVSEMALSTALLVGAMLLVRSVVALENAQLGFEPRGLYFFTIPFDATRYPSEASRAPVARAFADRLRAMPHVGSVALADVEPGGRSYTIGRLEVEGEAPPSRETAMPIEVNAVQRGYFATMGIRFAQGGVFADTSATNRDVIVNESFAKAHWPAESALGKRVRITESGTAVPDTATWLRIVGVIRDAQTSGAARESTGPILIRPMSAPTSYPKVLVRTTGGASSLAGARRFLVEMGVSDHEATMISVEEAMAQTIQTPRYTMLLLTIFTVIAVCLTAVGLYGVMAHAVAAETREIGIRVALGASGARIGRRVIARGALLAVAGGVVGLVAAAWGTRLLESQLYGVTRLDATSYAAGAIVLLATALTACVVPTRRALAVDPMTAIRAD
jgi:putative ABC transport system permease protein